MAVEVMAVVAVTVAVAVMAAVSTVVVSEEVVSEEVVSAAAALVSVFGARDMTIPTATKVITKASPLAIWSGVAS